VHGHPARRPRHADREDPTRSPANSEKPRASQHSRTARSKNSRGRLPWRCPVFASQRASERRIHSSASFRSSRTAWVSRGPSHVHWHILRALQPQPRRTSRSQSSRERFPWRPCSPQRAERRIYWTSSVYSPDSWPARGAVRVRSSEAHSHTALSPLPSLLSPPSSFPTPLLTFPAPAAHLLRLHTPPRSG